MSADKNSKTKLLHRGLDEEALQRVLKYVNDNLSDKVVLADVAKVANLSLYHFSRVFKAKTGTTMHQFIIDARLQRARHLLQTRTYSVKRAARAVGFCSHSHLNKYFRRRYGESVQEFVDRLPPQVVAAISNESVAAEV